MRSLKLRVGIFGAEIWSQAARDAIETAFNIKAINIFGLSEMMGPGIAAECLEAQSGMHIFEDHFIVETVNPQTGEVLPEGEEGELVFTSLTKEAFPLIRYRSGEISRLILDPCRCGRTHVRMERVLKRSDDMLTIRGINVFPAQIEDILKEIEGVEVDYQLIIDKVGALDAVELHVEVSEKYFGDAGGVKELQAIEKRIIKDMKDYLSISPRVKLIAPQSLKDKGKKVIDKRII
jgi:phenylacetate-CoA ligase